MLEVKYIFKGSYSIKRVRSKTAGQSKEASHDIKDIARKTVQKIVQEAQDSGRGHDGIPSGLSSACLRQHSQTKLHHAPLDA